MRMRIISLLVLSVLPLIQTAPAPLSTTNKRQQSSSSSSSSSSGQVTVQGPSTAANDPALPILALTYVGDAGPHKCRGSIMSSLSFSKPAAASQQTTAVAARSTNGGGTCYNLPTAANCGIFIANKADGCEARLYNMPGCPETDSTYVNTVVFMPERRPVGGQWRSMLVRCGVKAPDMAAVPDLRSLLGGAVVRKGGKGGKGR